MHGSCNASRDPSLQRLKCPILGPEYRLGVATYGQFCPVSKTADVLCQRWAILVVRELVSGSSRFGEIQRGVPGCPPATLSKRLRELEAAGVVIRVTNPSGTSYELTDAGNELYSIVEGFGQWGQRWARSAYGPDELDADVLLWDVRRFLDPNGLGTQPVVVQLDIRTERGRRSYWAVAEDDTVDLCLVDPERPVDAVLDADLRTLTEIWMGDINFCDGLQRGDIVLLGPDTLTRRIPSWFGRHPVLAPINQAPTGSTHDTERGAQLPGPVAKP